MSTTEFVSGSALTSWHAPSKRTMLAGSASFSTASGLGMRASNCSSAFAGIKRQQILGRGQRDVRSLRRPALKTLARDVEIGPAAGAEIGVEGDARAAPARAVKRREQPRPPRLVVDRERDRGEIDDIVAGERLQDVLGLGQIHQLARRGAVAPVEELSLALGVGLDHVDAGQFALEPRHVRRADALGLPARDHLVAQRVVAERGDIVDLDTEA